MYIYIYTAYTYAYTIKNKAISRYIIYLY